MKKIMKVLLVIFSLFIITGCNAYKDDFTVKFFADNSLIETQYVSSGGDTVSPAAPSKDGYTFIGWDKDLTNITSDLDINAIFEKIIYTFNVKFYNDGVLLNSQVIEKNGNAIAPAAISKIGYNFTGWDKNFDNVVADMDIVAVFSPITYSITYYDGINKVSLSPATYTVEDLVTLPNPEKDGFLFEGWYDSSSFTNRVVSYFPGTIGNKSLYAKWEELETDFVMPVGSFTISLNQKTPNPPAIVYSCTLGAGSPDTSRLQYDWASSNDSVATVSSYSTIAPVSSGFTVISGTYKSDANKIGYLLIKVEAGVVREATAAEVNDKTTYAVTFLNFDDSVIEVQDVAQGRGALLPTTPPRPGYVFFGWDKSHLNIQAATSIKATYIVGDYSFAGKSVTILGDSVSTYLGTMPAGYQHFYPYSTSGVGDVNQMWWMQVINKLGMKLLINNSYSGTTVRSISGNQNAGEVDSRLEKCHVGNDKPDYIFVFMGVNDCRANVSLNDFTTSYTNMVTKLKNAYPQATLVLGTLTTGPFTTGYGDVAGYNSSIKSIALLNGYGVFDFESAININNYQGLICDSVHPNSLGMNALYTQALSDILYYKNIVSN